MTTTMREARRKLRALGLRIKSTGWDDYRVYWPEDANNRETGYFTPDLQDAIETAHAMAAERAAAAARRRKHLEEGKPMLTPGRIK